MSSDGPRLGGGKKKEKRAFEEDDGDQKKPAAKKTSKKSGPAVIDSWDVSLEDVMVRDYGTVNSSKIACFDLDGTLINVKGTSDFAKGPDDWKLFNKNVPVVLKKYHEDGFKIAIFTNQGGIRSALGGKNADTVRGKISNFLSSVGVPAIVFAATKKDEVYRKPLPGMWNLLVSCYNGGIAPDMAGRTSDFRDPETNAPTRADIDFAANAGLTFKLPETMFGEMEGKKKLVLGSVNDVDLSAGPNAELLSIFKELSDFYRNCGRENAQFKANAFNKVVKNLSGFLDKVEASNLKEVGKIEGVGKGSLGIIKEYVESGKVEELENIRKEQAGGPSTAPPKPHAPLSEAAKQASKFM